MTYTTEITTTRAWLTLATDPTDTPIVAGTTRQSALSEAQDGEIRQYAGGRRQGVTYPPVLRSVPITFVGLSAAQLQTFRDRRGVTVLFRSKVGERFYCQYLAIAEAPTQHSSTLNDGRHFDVTVTLYEVDYDEAVEIPPV